MRLPRSCGILLHPTSLPGRFGVGDLGPEAVGFLDFLADTGQRWWQMLPVGPTGHGNSPYQSPSSFAGSPLLISPERLADEGLLTARDWAGLPEFPFGLEAKNRLTGEEIQALVFGHELRGRQIEPDEPYMRTTTTDGAAHVTVGSSFSSSGVSRIEGDCI